MSTRPKRYDPAESKSTVSSESAICASYAADCVEAANADGSPGETAAVAPHRPLGRITSRLVKAAMRGMTCRAVVCFMLTASATLTAGPEMRPAAAHAAPAPEVEYAYDAVARRHYSFPNNDAVAYGHGICDKVTRGESYAAVMSEVKADVSPNDEFAANYLIGYAVNLLCPTQIWQLRRSAGGYRPPGGETWPDTYY